MNGHRLLGLLQLPVAVVGAGLAALGYRALVRLPSPDTGGVFGSALALLTLSLVVWAGLVLFPLGLLIPRRMGVRYRVRRQPATAAREPDDHRRRWPVRRDRDGVRDTLDRPTNADAQYVCGVTPAACCPSLACRAYAPVARGIATTAGQPRIGARAPNGSDQTTVSVFPTPKPPRDIHRPPRRPSVL